MCFIFELCFCQPTGSAKQDLPKMLGETGKSGKTGQEERLLTVCWDMLAKQLCVGEK